MKQATICYIQLKCLKLNNIKGRRRVSVSQSCFKLIACILFVFTFFTLFINITAILTVKNRPLFPSTLNKCLSLKNVDRVERLAFPCFHFSNSLQDITKGIIQVDKKNRIFYHSHTSCNVG